MIVQELLKRQFGVKTTMNINPLVGQVGTTPIRILANNPNRLAWTLINLSAGYIMLGFDLNVSITRGIYIAAGGGGINFKWNEEFEAVAWEVYGVAQNLGSDIYIIEVVATEVLKPILPTYI